MARNLMHPFPLMFRLESRGVIACLPPPTKAEVWELLENFLIQWLMPAVSHQFVLFYTKTKTTHKFGSFFLFKYTPFWSDHALPP